MFIFCHFHLINTAVGQRSVGRKMFLINMMLDLMLKSTWLRKEHRSAFRWRWKQNKYVAIQTESYPNWIYFYNVFILLGPNVDLNKIQYYFLKHTKIGGWGKPNGLAKMKHAVMKWKLATFYMNRTSPISPEMKKDLRM